MTVKVRIAYTVEVDDDTRAFINDFYGNEGKANRQQVRNWFERFGHCMDDEIGASV